MNLELTKEYTAVEVELALKQMKSITTPRPDGMPLFSLNTIGIPLAMMSLLQLSLS